MSQKTEQKQKSHEAILESAATLIRQRGIKASSVLEVMQGAGLTVGGFYGHFDSKEQLFTQTLAYAADAMWQKLLSLAKGSSPRERMLNVLYRYLSRRHRDNPESGCLLPNVTAEIAHEGEPYRSALATQLDRFAHSLAQLLGPEAENRDTALALIALMYGALSLSRALSGTPLSDEFLRAAKKVGASILPEDPTD